MIEILMTKMGLSNKEKDDCVFTKSAGAKSASSAGSRSKASLESNGYYKLFKPVADTINVYNYPTIYLFVDLFKFHFCACV
jgi:hypothetical protein